MTNTQTKQCIKVIEETIQLVGTTAVALALEGVRSVNTAPMCVLETLRQTAKACQGIIIGLEQIKMQMEDNIYVRLEKPIKI